jgi:hypothetical protein
MVGNRTLQEAHAYEPGKHGLFTYHLLRGLQGLADLDRDGTVAAECTGKYIKMDISKIADFDYEREEWYVRPDPELAADGVKPEESS